MPLEQRVVNEELESQPGKQAGAMYRRPHIRENPAVSQLSLWLKNYGLVIVIGIGLALFGVREFYALFVAEPATTRATAPRQAPAQLQAVGNRQPPLSAAPAMPAGLHAGLAANQQTLQAGQDQRRASLAALSGPGVKTTSGAPELTLVVEPGASAAKKTTAPLVLNEAARKEREVMKSHLKQIDERLDHMHEFMSRLQLQMVEITKTIKNKRADEPQGLQSLKQDIQKLNSKINILSSGYGLAPEHHGQQYAAPMRQKVTPKGTQPTLSKPKMPVAVAGYGLEAVIPGRAWLTTPEGVLITVTLGDVIPGLGQVITIDSMAGAVVTNGGHVIKESVD